MKTNQIIRTLAMAVIAVFNTISQADAQEFYQVPTTAFSNDSICTTIQKPAEIREIYMHDYLMPGKGKSMVSLYTGVPYIGVGEFAYGISNRFSVSAFLGFTPINYAVGSRIKVVAIETSDNFRINLKTTAIYYPFIEFGEGDPWVLGWQAANAEWKLKNGSRIWVGAGILGVSCLDMLFPPKGGKKMMPPKDAGEKEMEMEGVFNTFQFGYSKPLSNHTSFVVEVAPVMQGLKLKEKSGFLDAFPVIVTTGFTHSF